MRIFICLQTKLCYRITIIYNVAPSNTKPIIEKIMYNMYVKSVELDRKN
jgi:hypothetical protein